jgi:hypothetical protein
MKRQNGMRANMMLERKTPGIAPNITNFFEN